MERALQALARLVDDADAALLFLLHCDNVDGERFESRLRASLIEAKEALSHAPRERRQMAESKMQIHTTRTTKRSSGNSKPDDPFKTEAEVSMESLATGASTDGRNPAITGGKDAPSSRP